jgi:hypothetical protein
MTRYALAAALFAVAVVYLFLPPQSAISQPAGNGWGSVKGQFVFGGAAIPAPKPIDVSMNADKDHCLSKGPLMNEEWVIDPKSKGVRWVFVWLAPAKPEDKLPIHPDLKDLKEKSVAIDQPVCQFIPHAVALREGQDLIAKNSATKPHNVNWTGHPLKNPGNNVIVPPSQQHVIQGLKADRFPVSVKCNIHPWMQAWVRVFDHPYYAVTDAQGNFEIKQAPAGKWQLASWHESGYGPGGRDGVPVTINPNATTNAGQLQIGK